MSEEQKAIDKRKAEWSEKWNAQRKKLLDERIGKDVESIRGTTGYLPRTGLHYWDLRWRHNPGREGKCDAVGICSDLFESFGPGPGESLLIYI